MPPDHDDLLPPEILRAGNPSVSLKGTHLFTFDLLLLIQKMAELLP